MAIILAYGDGTAPKNVVEKGIDDLFDGIDTEKDEGFWFIFPYDGKPGPGMKRVLAWAMDSKINKTSGAFYYELVVPTGSSLDDNVIDGAGKIHKAKDITGKALELVSENETEVDPGKVIILWDDKDEAQESFIATALAAQLDVLDATNAMTPILFDSDEESGDGAEPEQPKKAPPAKGKAPAAKKEPEPSDDDKPTREELEAMPTRALKAIAKAEGVDIDGLDDAAIINAILGEEPEPEPTPEPEPEKPAAPKRGRGKAAAKETPAETGTPVVGELIGAVGYAGGLDPAKVADFLDAVAGAWRSTML
jgi:hypothetical protein